LEGFPGYLQHPEAVQLKCEARESVSQVIALSDDPSCFSLLTRATAVAAKRGERFDLM